jgi:hypothetical protein
MFATPFVQVCKLQVVEDGESRAIGGIEKVLDREDIKNTEPEHEEYTMEFSGIPGNRNPSSFTTWGGRTKTELVHIIRNVSARNLKLINTIIVYEPHSHPTVNAL